jgi:hypothetical protein
LLSRGRVSHRRTRTLHKLLKLLLLLPLNLLLHKLVKLLLLKLQASDSW